MRRFLVVLLLTVLSFQQGLKIGVIAWWTINRSRIAQTLCENRNRPQLKCCGRCVLNKQLRKADGAEKSPGQQAQQKNKKEEPAVVTDAGIYWHTLPRLFSGKTNFLDPAVPSLLQGNLSAPFQPPRA